MNVDVEKVFGDQKLNILLQKANTDQEYIELRNLVDKGFPPKRSMLPDQLKPYWIFRDKLTNFKRLVLMNEKKNCNTNRIKRRSP